MTEICKNNSFYKKLNKLFLKNNLDLLNIIELLKIDNSKNIINNIIKNNWHNIILFLKEFNLIIDDLKKNINLERSLIGDFIERYNKYRKYLLDMDTFTKNLLLIIDTSNFMLELKQLLFILSNKKRCYYLKDEKKNIKLTNKHIKNIYLLTNGNIDLMKSYLVNKKIKNYWGDKKCDYIRDIYELLVILKTYYKDPIKLYKIKINYKKNKNYIDDILLDYVIKYKNDNFNKDNIDNVGTLILFLRDKMSIWEAIDLIFDNIFNKCEIIDIEKSKIFENEFIEYQRNNINYAFKIYILVKYNFISNINIFNNFYIK